MGDIVSFAEYKAEKGIPPARSPYYTTKATKSQINEATRYAAEFLRKPIDVSGRLPYAVVIGYEDTKTHLVKLLKEVAVYPTREVLISMAGRKGANVVSVVRK